MKIIGIDPGTARIGWGVVNLDKSVTSAEAYGCITTPAQQSESDRLLTLYQSINKIFSSYRADAVAVESLFFATNAKTAISVGQARGVIILAASLAKLPVASYTPLQIKQAVTGDGRADKRQVEKMIVMLLRLPSIPQPDDTADALAVALTHAAMYNMKTRTVLL